MLAPAPLPLETQFPIDGIVDFTTLSNVREQAMEFLDSQTNVLAKSGMIRWAFLNDDRDLYLALEWTDDSWHNQWSISQGPLDVDSVQVLFDVDGDGQFEFGEDARQIVAGSVGSFYIDQHKAVGDTTDLVGDGYGKLRYDALDQKYQAEFLIPLAPEAMGEDGLLGAATRFNVLLFDHLSLQQPSANIAELFPDNEDSSVWESLPLVPVAPLAHAQIPSGLEGLLVFVSTHEDPIGEIYTFDPMSSIVSRVTNNSFFEDNVSLSPDRSRIAFHGASSVSDYFGYEIFTVRIDGSEWTQLTTNAILDGHPAWSPDGSKIVYASFRDPKASIVVMDASGVEIADLTPPEFDDNDPDFLPDGRIVFKTDRWSALPQVKIGTMGVNGTGAIPVTISDSGSDHDPVSDGEFALFERFLKGTDYATDIDAGFTPWNIVEARVDGSGEKTVLSNGWVNWLPLYDPSRQYIAFQKSCGYTAVHLMTREGKDLGRLIPGITRIRYIDWK